MHQFIFNYLPNFKSIMGKIKQGILGGFSGKVANVVGSSWKGIAVMKSLPLSVANPKTAAQLLQRNRFKLLVSFAASLLSSIVKPLWDRFAQKMSGFNDFVSNNFDAFFQGQAAIDYEKLVISKGKMSAPTISSVTETEPGTISIAFTTDESDPYALDSDQVYLAAIDIEDKKAFPLSAGESSRAISPISIELPANLDTEHDHYVYMAFKRIDGTIVSDSGYYLWAAQ